MSFHRLTFVAVAVLFAQGTPDVSGFSATPLATKRSITQSRSAIYAEPSASEKAAELRKKAEEAKLKAEGLKKVAEQKAEAAMMAVKAANERSAKITAEAKKKRTPTPPPPPKENKASTRVVADPADGAIIPINSDNIEFTSGFLGGALALALGASPVFAVVAAAAANYVSKKEDLGEVAELVQGVSKASLNTVNWFAKLNTKYTIADKLSDSLDKSLDELKNSEGESAETVKKIEDSVSKTTKQLNQLAEEIDLFAGAKQALGAVGEVLETSIDKALDANKEYKLTERATDAAKKAIEKAKDNK